MKERFVTIDYKVVKFLKTNNPIVIKFRDINDNISELKERKEKYECDKERGENIRKIVDLLEKANACNAKINSSLSGGYCVCIEFSFASLEEMNLFEKMTSNK